MSYRCDICGIKVPHRQQRLVHTVFKTFRTSGALIQPRQIARELSCCEGCHLMLDEVPLKSVKDPYYLRAKQGKDKTEIDHEARPSALFPEVIEFDLEETFSRR